MNFQSFLLKITAPHASVKDHSEARRMRALAAVSLFLALSTCINSLTYVIVGTPGTETVRNLLALCSVVFFSTYALLRTKWRVLGIYGVFFTLISLVQGRVFDPLVTADSLMIGLMFASVIQTAGVLVFTFRSGVIFSIMNYVLVLLAFALRPEIRTTNGMIIAFFVLSQSLFTILLASITNIERQIASRLSAIMAVSEIVAGIAHNLNSPLAAAKLMITRMSRVLAAKKDAQNMEVIELAAKMGRSVGSALIISRSLQYFVDPNRESQAEGRFLLSEHCSEAIGRCKESFNFDHIELRFDANKFPQLMVKGNADRFIHALENLISSSVKLLPNNAPGMITLEIEEQDHFATISIGDSSSIGVEILRELANDELSSSTRENKGDYLEVRLARPLFEKCGAKFSIGKNAAADRYLVSLEKATS